MFLASLLQQNPERAHLMLWKVYLGIDFAASSYEHVGFLQLFPLNLQPEIESYYDH